MCYWHALITRTRAITIPNQAIPCALIFALDMVENGSWENKLSHDYLVSLEFHIHERATNIFRKLNKIISPQKSIIRQREPSFHHFTIGETYCSNFLESLKHRIQRQVSE